MADYCFDVYTTAEEIQMKEFLGIDPPGPDIDTYLGGLTRPELTEWAEYWWDVWDNLGRRDMEDFVNEWYQRYYEGDGGPLPPELPEGINANILYFELNPDVVTRGNTFEWMVRIYNYGDTRDWNTVLLFYNSDGDLVTSSPWVKIFNIPTDKSVTLRMTLKIPDNFPVGDYLARCGIYAFSEGGTKLRDINGGAIYEGGSLSGLGDSDDLGFRVT